MVRFTLALASLLAASSAFAEVTIKPKLIHSQLTLDAKSTVDDEGIEEDVDGGKRWVPGKGAGVDFEYSLNDRARVGAGLSYTEFERYDTKHFDTALGGYAALDLLKTDAFSLYGKAGLSAHQFGTETFKPATLLNLDVGAGAAVAVAQNVDVGAEYQYSTSIVKDDMKAKDWDFRVKDLSQTRNDYSLFVAMTF